MGCYQQKTAIKSAKNGQNQPKMHILGQKIFFHPKIEPYESYFCKHPPEVPFERFLGLWDHFSKSHSVFRFFHLFENRHFLAQIGMYQGYGKHFSQKPPFFLKYYYWSTCGPNLGPKAAFIADLCLFEIFSQKAVFQQFPIPF